MDLVYASDDKFTEVLGISMISLLENNAGENIGVYILDEGISAANKAVLTRIADKYSAKIFFVDVKNMLDPNMKQCRGSLSTFSRLYLDKLLPQNIEKIIYLDCDTLILKSLKDFYATDVSGYFFAGVNDCVSRSHIKAVGLNDTGNYMNAGVLLINLEKWREENASEKFIDFSESHKNNVLYADQGIINGVFGKNSLRMSPEYNCYTAMYDFTYKDLTAFRKPYGYYDENDIESSKKDPVIVHFTTSFLSMRPWEENCRHPFADEWLKYKSMSEWADMPLKKDGRSAGKKIAVKVYKALPKVLAVNIAGVLHAGVVPMLNHIGII